MSIIAHFAECLAKAVNTSHCCTDTNCTVLQITSSLHYKIFNFNVVQRTMSLLRTSFKIPSCMHFPARRISSIVPNPKKVTIVSQYARNTMDFSFLPSDYSVEFIDADRVQSKQEFIDKIKRIDKNRVVINLIDNCEDSANEKLEKYIGTDTVKILEDLDAPAGKLKPNSENIESKSSEPTYFKVSGLAAIEWYNRLDLAHTGASASNFATKKTDLKVRGVPTPRHAVVRNRDINTWRIQYRDGSYSRSNAKFDTPFPLKFPVIIKPLKDYGGSTFIQEKMKCNNISELHERIKSFPVPDMLVEEFVIGEEYAVLLYQEPAGGTSEELIMKNAHKKLNAKLNLLASRLSKKANINNQECKQKILESATDVTQNLFKAKPRQSLCTVTDPIQIILPSKDAFQHEEMKWQLINAVFKKLETGKVEKGYMMQYRMVPQALFAPRSKAAFSPSKRTVIIKMLRELVNGSLERKAELEQEIRDSFLHRAIEKAVRKAWRILKHDGYFRYDIRVVETFRKPFQISQHAEMGRLKILEKMPLQKLYKFLPSFGFKVYIIDANPYCSLFAIPDCYDEADSMLEQTPNQSHLKFTQSLIKSGITRELHRRSKIYSELLKKKNWEHLSKVVSTRTISDFEKPRLN